MAAPGGAVAAPGGAPVVAPLRSIVIEEECEEIVAETGLTELADAIGSLEGVGSMTMDVLKSVGVGGASGVRLLDCVGAEETAKYRTAYTKELLAVDPRLAKLTPALGKTMVAVRTANSMKEMMRRLAALCERLKKEERGGAAGDAAAIQKGTLTVTTQSEEDREMTLVGFDAEAVKTKCELLKEMYNLRMQPYEKATLSQMKRIGYWVVSEKCFPDPNRYAFTKLTAVSTDGNLVQFRRMLVGCVLVAAGVVAPADKRDDGAGAKDLRSPYKSQWANANVAEDLLAQLEEKRDVMSNVEYGHVCAALATALFKATSLGGVTLSLAMAQTMSTVPQMMQNAMALGAREKKLPQPGGELTDAQKKKKKKEEERRKRQLEALGGEEGRKKQRGGETPGGGGRYADEEGALGPNKLPRKAGGNPLGDRCKYLAEGKACPFKTCSFSHAA